MVEQFGLVISDVDRCFDKLKHLAQFYLNVMLPEMF